jgi:hypothetical protein
MVAFASIAAASLGVVAWADESDGGVPDLALVLESLDKVGPGRVEAEIYEASRRRALHDGGQVSCVDCAEELLRDADCADCDSVRAEGRVD